MQRRTTDYSGRKLNSAFVRHAQGGPKDGKTSLCQQNCFETLALGDRKKNCDSRIVNSPYLHAGDIFLEKRHLHRNSEPSDGGFVSTVIITGVLYTTCDAEETRIFISEFWHTEEQVAGKDAGKLQREKTMHRTVACVRRRIFISKLGPSLCTSFYTSTEERQVPFKGSGATAQAKSHRHRNIYMQKTRKESTMLKKWRNGGK